MKKIDLGFLNRKQLIRLIKGVKESDVNIIAIQIVKATQKMSVVLKFINKKDKERFDVEDYNLIQDLKRLGGE